MIDITFSVDGRTHSLVVRPGDTLLEVLRDEGHAAVKSGCASGDCGACAVLLDGEVVNACFVFAVHADGREITTAASLAHLGELHPLQRAFLDAGAVQCGFCTPGMLVTAVDLLARNPDPSEDEVRQALAGTLCRCTGFVKPVEAVLRAAEELLDVARGGAVRDDQAHGAQAQEERVHGGAAHGDAVGDSATGDSDG